MKVNEDVIALYSINNRLSTFLNNVPVTFPTTVSSTFRVTVTSPNQFALKIANNFTLNALFYAPRFDLYLYLSTDTHVPSIPINGGLCGNETATLVGGDGYVVPASASQANIDHFGQSCTFIIITHIFLFLHFKQGL